MLAKTKLAFIALVLLGLPVFVSQPVYADHCGSDVTVSVPVGDYNGDGKTDAQDHCVKAGNSVDTNPIITYLKAIINFMAIGIGLVTAISIIIGGFQFMASKGNPQTIQAAQKRIWNGVIAIVLFVFMYAILNFLVPGGLIG